MRLLGQEGLVMLQFAPYLHPVKAKTADNQVITNRFL
jgi:hypothetical protein